MEVGKRPGGCRLKGKGTVINTATEYAEVSSIHGISYIFERNHGIVSRFAWLVMVLSAVTLGVYWSFKVKLYVNVHKLFKELQIS